MKALALAATIMAGPAAAERFELSTHGDWTVTFVSETDGDYCTAEVGNVSGDYLSFDIHPHKVEAWYMSEANAFGNDWSEGSVFLTIDGNKPWRTPAQATSIVVIMTGLTVGFIVQVADGQWIRIDLEGDGEAEAWFSLDGSRAALEALADCSKKIGGML